MRTIRLNSSMAFGVSCQCSFLSANLRRGLTLTIKILVVDHEGHVQAMLKEILTPLECQVITASSAALGIFLARKNFPSLIVLNLSRQEDEFELPQEVSNDPDLAHIPVLVFHPVDNPDLAKACTGDGRVLPKPADVNELRSLLIPYLRVFEDDRDEETTE